MADVAYSRLDVEDAVKDGTQGHAPATRSSWSRDAKYRSAYNRYLKRRGCFIGVGIALLVLCSMWLVTRRITTTVSQDSHVSYSDRPWIQPGLLPDRSKVILHTEPQDSFRDNLVPGVNYALTTHVGGWTNQIMGDANLILYTIRTDRVPVLIPFEPSQDGTKEAGFLSWSDVFDMDLFQRLIHHPVLEWKMLQRTYEHVPGDQDLKKHGRLMCWEAKSHWGGNEWFWDQQVGLEAWPLPSHVTDGPEYATDFQYTIIDKVMQFLGNPADIQSHLQRLNDTWSEIVPRGHPDSPPEEQFQCFINTYFWKTAAGPDAESEILSPQVWRQIATHLHWKQSLVEKAFEYEKQIFESENPPKYISVHLRHGDFKTKCSAEHIEKGTCFASADTIAEYVKQIRDKLVMDDVDNVRVLIASDDHEPKFKQDLQSRGFILINHEKLGTEKALGQWGPTLIDAILLSRGVGFVGSDRSTYSHFAASRIQDWNGGPTTWLPRLT